MSAKRSQRIYQQVENRRICSMRCGEAVCAYFAFISQKDEIMRRNIFPIISFLTIQP